VGHRGRQRQLKPDGRWPLPAAELKQFRRAPVFSRMREERRLKFPLTPATLPPSGSHIQRSSLRGPVTGMVLAAGINTPARTWADQKMKEFAAILDTNLTSVARAIDLVLPGMRQVGQGNIVVVSSHAAWRYAPGAGVAYMTSKTALSSLVASVNDQEGINGIKACHLCPGEVDTGPDLGHFLHWMHSRARNLRGWPQLAGQLLRSSYVAAFQIPVLPEVAWRLFLTRLYEKAAGRCVNDDPVRGLALYRSNFFPSRKLPPPAPISVPVNVLIPLKDPFLSPHLTAGLRSWVTDLTVTPVDGGHWWPATHPKELAKLLQVP
jgi:NAD(P)-dependent dehydrogenase (short-subunit alcohol dehydrogenase family)